MQGDQSESSTTLALLVRYLICYVCWLVAAAVAFWLMLQLRINLLDLGMVLDVGPWILGAVDKFGFLILGLLWLIAVFVVEHYFRTGVHENVLGSRVARVFLIEGILLAGSYGFQWLYGLWQAS